MTKKSAARLERDRIEKEREKFSGWDELNNIFNACRDTLIGANSDMVALFRTPEIMANIPDRINTSTAIRGLGKDLIYFTKELNDINSKHSGRAGAPKDEEETIACLQIFESYVAFESRYQSVIMPTIIYLAEQAGLAKQKMIDDLKALETTQVDTVTDVNVVTDVAIKETIVSEIPTAI
jgi:hypothetical protein